VIFIIDAQLPGVFAHALTQAGYPAKAVREIGLRDATDELIWTYALDHQAAIITKDEDFARRTWRTTQGPSIVWLRFGNCSNAFLIECVLPLLPEIVSRFAAGDRLVEIF
jgi:predicted nuclease of predicted toxin-antitoxin system